MAADVVVLDWRRAYLSLLERGMRPREAARRLGVDRSMLTGSERFERACRVAELVGQAARAGERVDSRFAERVLEQAERRGELASVVMARLLCRAQGFARERHASMVQPWVPRPPRAA